MTKPDLETMSVLYQNSAASEASFDNWMLMNSHWLYRFYGRNSSYVHGGVDASGKPQEAVYGQNVSTNFIYILSFFPFFLC